MSGWESACLLDGGQRNQWPVHMEDLPCRMQPSKIGIERENLHNRQELSLCLHFSPICMGFRDFWTRNVVVMNAGSSEQMPPGLRSKNKEPRWWNVSLRFKLLPKLSPVDYLRPLFSSLVSIPSLLSFPSTLSSQFCFPLQSLLSLSTC